TEKSTSSAGRAKAPPWGCASRSNGPAKSWKNERARAAVFSTVWRDRARRMDKARILVVEDEDLLAEDIQERLKNLGYEVTAVAHSGEEALASVASTQPDLVLMDIRLKGNMDGIDAARVIRERFNLPVVYLTGEAGGATLERAKATEPLGYLLKPIDEKRLYSTVEIALYKHKMDQRLRRIERWFATTLKSEHQRARQALQESEER